MKNIWRIALSGYLFGLFALIVCVAAVATGIVADMGLSLLLFPVISPVLLVIIDAVSKSVWTARLFGRGALLRWMGLGIWAGMLYTARVMVEESGQDDSLFAVLFLVLLLVPGWILFWPKKTAGRRGKPGLPGKE